MNKFFPTKKVISAILVFNLVASIFCGCTAEAMPSDDAEVIATVTPIETTPVTEPSVPETEPTETAPPIIDEVPMYNQLECTCPYGNVILASNGQEATVRNSGCGITCLAMVATYMLDDPTLTPDVMAERFGKYNTKVGSDWALFTEGAEALGLGEVKKVHDWRAGEVEQALRNGSLVISNQRGGVFTTGGHYILLTGITEDGKVMVHDPNGANWTNPDLVDGFENGFKHTDVSYTSAAYWIYAPKDNNK